MTITQNEVMNYLKTVIDPEIGLNIVELGLIYGIEISDVEIIVTMTLTTAGCPMHSSMTTWVENSVKLLDRNRNVKVNLVWQPAWTPDRMSPEAKEKLGMN